MLQSVASDPAEVQAVSRQLEAMHFQRADVQRAIADVCQLRSSSTFSSPLVNFSTAHNLKDAALEYLLLLLPESALPAGFQNKKPTMTARVHVSQDADALSRSWLAQTIHSDTGFPLPLVQEYLSLAKGDEGLCLDLLVQKSLYAADQGLDGLKRRNSDREGVETRRADEILALKSIYPDSVRQQGQRLVIELANGRAHFHVLYHPASTYPSPKVPPTLYCSTPAAGYINMYLTLQAYRILSTDLEPSLTEGHGVLLELLDILNELVPATLANPPSLLEALPRNPGKSTAPAQQPALAATTRPHQSRTQAGPLSSRPIPNNRMAADLEKLSSTSAYQKMLVARSTLPAWSRQQEIVDLIASNRVTLIAGATGSGKTTQVPTYVLDHEIRQGRGADCSIVVTQPRRLAAIGVATRVAEERISDVGQADSLVGYQIRGERKSGRNCRLLFMTTGVLLRTLGSGQSDLRSVSHVVSSEVTPSPALIVFQGRR
jgi:ATP-dependent RNA helicase DHX57